MSWTIDKKDNIDVGLGHCRKTRLYGLDLKLMQRVLAGAIHIHHPETDRRATCDMRFIRLGLG